MSHRRTDGFRVGSPASPVRPGVPMAMGAVLLPLLVSCSEEHGVLSPAGRAAESIATLWWVMFGIATLVSALVFALLAYALFRRRREGEPMAGEEVERVTTRWIVLGGLVGPAIILSLLFFYVLRTLAVVAEPAGEARVTVEVVGKQWWWDVKYLDPQGANTFTTANELHIPVGERVRIRLRSADVIHSFWVPELNGKMDLIPGRVNEFWIQADRPGVYHGYCAEFCGKQHAHMRFRVVAESPARFAAWAEHQRRPAAEPEVSGSAAGGHAHAEGTAHPDPARGKEVFLRSGCAICHTVRGTPAGGEIGPDLTHVASRMTLAAGTLPNTKGHLGGWIANPQALKPGNRMPFVPLSSEEFHALLHYLQSLR